MVAHPAIIGLPLSTRSAFDTVLLRCVAFHGVSQICNLWFSNPDTDAVRKQLRTVRLPSWKWLPLIYQLAAKLGVADVGPELMEIVERCVVEHPHHTLFVLIALKNGRREDDSSAAAPRRTLLDNVDRLLDTVCILYD